MTQYFDPFTQAEDKSGASIDGATLQFFETTTTTPKNTFTDSSFSTANDNPVTADGFGRFPPIFLDVSAGLYTVILIDDDGAVIKSQDGVGGASDGAGHVVGPSSSLDNAIARWNLTTGELLQDSLTTMGDDGSIIPAAFIGRKKGGDIASASPLVIDTDGDYFDVTGNTGFSVMTVAANRSFVLQFDSTPTITVGSGITLNNAASNFTVAAGDHVVCQSTAANTVVGWIIKVDGTAVVKGAITLGTPVATTSGTAFDFTSIPAGTKRITGNLNGVSVDATTSFIVQIGDSGGLETAGYAGEVVGVNVGTFITYSTSFVLTINATAAKAQKGRFVLELVDSSTNTWTLTTIITVGDGGEVSVGGGDKTLSGALDRIRFTTVAGSTFDLGKFNITFE